MKIKLFYEQARETLEQFEERVNEWAKGVDVVSVTTVAQTYGCEVDIRTVLAITVHYRWTNKKDRSQYERFSHGYPTTR